MACNPLASPLALFSGALLVHARLYSRDTNGFVAAKGAPNRKRPHLSGKHADQQF